MVEPNNSTKAKNYTALKSSWRNYALKTSSSAWSLPRSGYLTNKNGVFAQNGIGLYLFVRDFKAIKHFANQNSKNTFTSHFIQSTVLSLLNSRKVHILGKELYIIAVFTMQFLKATILIALMMSVPHNCKMSVYRLNCYDESHFPLTM